MAILWPQFKCWAYSGLTLSCVFFQSLAFPQQSFFLCLRVRKEGQRPCKVAPRPWSCKLAEPSWSPSEIVFKTLPPVWRPCKGVAGMPVNTAAKAKQPAFLASGGSRSLRAVKDVKGELGLGQKCPEDLETGIPSSLCTPPSSLQEFGVM